MDTTLATPTTKDRRNRPPSLENVRISALVSTDVVTFRPETTLTQAARTLVERSIGAAPIVDAEGVAIGILSKTDLARVTSVGATPRVLTAGDVMTPVALTAPPSATLHDVVDVMVRGGVHRILVVDPQGRPSGILTTMDVLRWLAGPRERRCPAVLGRDGDDEDRMLRGSSSSVPSPDLDLDLRPVPLNYITREVIETFRNLPPGHRFTLTWDHDPVNVLTHLRDLEGDAVSWRTVLGGERLFRVEVARSAAAISGAAVEAPGSRPASEGDLSGAIR